MRLELMLKTLLHISRPSWRMLAAVLVALPLISAASVTADEYDSPFSVDERSYWAFQKMVRPRAPQVRHVETAAGAIDAFILQRLEEKELTLSPPADRRTLLRRAKFDLLGLPPTPEEVEEFLADDSPQAYERLIERLLASPGYGEHWGRAWLDLVRYAETAGFNADPLRPLAYEYRDYVIRALNNDTPYDRFVQEQLAGDEMFPHSDDARIATGYNLMWPDESNASNILLARQDALNDLTGNVGAVFMGLSIGCAQCHDHKFDPILQSDFYQLQAFFAGIVPAESVPVGSNDQLSAYRSELAAWQKKTANVREELHKLESTARAKAGEEKRLKFPAVVLEAIDTAPEKRTAFQRQLAFWSERQIEVSEKQLLAQLNQEQQQRLKELREQWREMEKRRPRPSRQMPAMAVMEVASGPPVTSLLSGGSYDYPEEETPPGFLAVVMGEDNLADVQPPRADTSGRRTALARWLTDADNPLTARVMVNRIWQGHFGVGLVSNANDLGTQTPPPSHPELLDWLATEFISRGWSIKEMHRLMMTSAVYRQSGYRQPQDQPAPLAAKVDSDNQLYWHYPRRRLRAESIRDSMLAVSGRLSTAMYGPGVKPLLPPNFSSRHSWTTSQQAEERHRRSVYIHAKRNLPYPLLQVFDLPDMHESCACRSETTVAPQALMLLNSDMILGYASSLANRLLEEQTSQDLAPLVRQAYELTLGRSPTKAQLEQAADFILGQQALIAKDHANPADGKSPKQVEEESLSAALTDFCHALLNANEFIYID